MHKATALFNIRDAMPSDNKDPRFRLVRSPHCPNDIKQEDDAIPDKNRGTCGSCAWGFYKTDSSAQQRGEDPASLELTQVGTNEAPFGYKAQCGQVTLYRDNLGRVGALREIDGTPRFFAGIVGNWAYERYLKNNPSLKTN